MINAQPVSIKLDEFVEHGDYGRITSISAGDSTIRHEVSGAHARTDRGVTTYGRREQPRLHLRVGWLGDCSFGSRNGDTFETKHAGDYMSVGCPMDSNHGRVELETLPFRYHSGSDRYRLLTS